MARQAMLTSAAAGGKPKFKDFVRYHDTESEMTDADLPPEAFAAMFGAKKKES